MSSVNANDSDFTTESDTLLNKATDPNDSEPEAPTSLIAPFAPPSSGRAPQNTWLQTAFYLVAQMAGVGVLGIPAATAQSGWLGIPLLVLTAGICMITANLLGSIMMRMPQAAIRDYPSIGGAAFGKHGHRLAVAAQYSTLFGVSVIFLLLSGMFLNGIFCQVPARLFTLVIGILLFVLLIALPVLREVRFMAYLGVSTTFIATIMAITLAMIYYYSDLNVCNHKGVLAQVCNTCHQDVALLSIASGFSVYSFGFGGHSSIPNFFIEMKHPKHFYRTTAVVFPVSLVLLYLPMGVAGYIAYGRGLDEATGTILDAILFFDPGQKNVIIAINVILIIHLFSALPIIVTPICLLFQRNLIKDKSKRMTRSLPMIMVRLVIIALITLVAIVFPYFLSLVSIVTDISVVFSVYIFPAVFYWKLRTNVAKHGAFKTWMVRFGLLLIILFGLLGSVFGLINAIPNLVHAVKCGGNPFANIFTFGCGGSSGGGAGVPPTAPPFNNTNNTFMPPVSFISLNAPCHTNSSGYNDAVCVLQNRSFY